MMQLVSVLAVSLVLGTTQVSLHVRAAQSAAVCTGDYAWADNSKNVSPCQLAADVNGACHGGNWQIPALNSENHYDNPNTTSADLCSCSWLAYNLIGVCAACQGFQNVIQGWTPYKLACTGAGKLSSTYFPTDQIALPDDTRVPVWAAVDPSQWTDQTFNPVQAKQIANQAKPDIVPGATVPDSKKSSTPVGAIAGGVAGGVVALLAAGITWYMVRRRRKQQSLDSTNGFVAKPHDPGHGRNISDLSQNTTTSGFPYPSFGTFSPTLTPLLPTNGTLHTHTGSTHSMSYFGSAANSIAPLSPHPLSSISPLPASPSPPPVNREDIIVPYLLPSQSPTSSAPRASDRKRADGAVVLMYDQPTSRPVDIDGPLATRRPRFNPPEYTPYPEPGPDDSSSQINTSSSRTRPSHSKNDSAETQRSGETGNTSVVVTRGHGAGVRSVSALDDVVEQMGLDPPQNEHAGSVLPGGGSVVTTGGGGAQDNDVAM